MNPRITHLFIIKFEAPSPLVPAQNHLRQIQEPLQLCQSVEFEGTCKASHDFTPDKHDTKGWNTPAHEHDLFNAKENG
jgi:hypothetical protein